MSLNTENIMKFIDLCENVMSPKHIAVVGDMMLDIYDQVHVSRISPEFPIPVINCQDEKSCVVRPGGAGNVCEQLRNFTVDVSLCSILDVESCETLNDTKINYDSSLKFNYPGINVPVKRRYYDGDHPLVRMDSEKKNYGCNQHFQELQIELIKKFVECTEKNKPDVVILSDYNKGIFNSSVSNLLISRCKDLNIPSIVDPKKNEVNWEGCTIFKPNLAEAAVFLQRTESWIIENWLQAIIELRNIVKCESVVITAGSKGVFILDKNNCSHYQPSHVVGEVRSVIGAGDCFVAILALAIANGYNVTNAAQIAYEAGVVYVQNKHNKPIWSHQLLGRVSQSQSKILSPKNLAKYLKAQKHKQIVFSNGCFDILHHGHISALEFAKKQGDILVVGINTDKSVNRLKGKGRPINELNNRQIMLAALSCVDFVTYFDEDTPEELIKKIQPNVIVKSDEYAIEEVVGHETCKVILSPMKPGISTTAIIEKMKS